MTTNNSMYKDFVKAQKEFKPVVFNRVNPFHKSKYADLGAHLDSVIGALNNNNFSLIQKTHECNIGVSIETILIHESGEQISGGILNIPVVKNDPQGHGAALTYARRFSLGSLLSLYGEEDNDGNEHLPDKQPDKPINKPVIDKKLDDLKKAQIEAKAKAELKYKEELTLSGEQAASKGKISFIAWYKTVNVEGRKLLVDKMQDFENKCKDSDELIQDKEE